MTFFPKFWLWPFLQQTPPQNNNKQTQNNKNNDSSGDPSLQKQGTGSGKTLSQENIYLAIINIQFLIQ